MFQIIFQFLLQKRFILGILTIVILISQTPKSNLLLLEFSESGLFSNYSEAYKVLRVLTFCTIFLFFVSLLL